MLGTDLEQLRSSLLCHLDVTEHDKRRDVELIVYGEHIQFAFYARDRHFVLIHLSHLLRHFAVELLAAENVEVQVLHGLAAVVAAVVYDTVAVCESE